MAHFCIKHGAVQAVIWPAHLKVFLDKHGTISIGGVDLFDCITLGHATAHQSMDLVIARSIEKRTEDTIGQWIDDTFVDRSNISRKSECISKSQP
jgi:hypothetical protein